MQLEEQLRIGISLCPYREGDYKLDITQPPRLILMSLSVAIRLGPSHAVLPGSRRHCDRPAMMSSVKKSEKQKKYTEVRWHLHTLPEAEQQLSRSSLVEPIVMAR